MNQCSNCNAYNDNKARYCSICGHALPGNITENQEDEAAPAKAVKLKKRTTLTILGVIFGIAVFLALYFSMQKLFHKPPSFDKVMTAAASELNKMCPMMLDSETRLDNVMTLPPNIFQYNYTLVNYEKESVDTLAMKEYLEPQTINFVRTSPDMQYARDNNAVINYSYKDKNGNYLFKISISSKQYK